MHRLSVKFQDWLSQASVPLTFGLAVLLLRGVFRYRWENLRAFRSKVQKLLASETSPFLLCPNHLTMIDSLLLIWAMTPAWKAMAKPRLFPWNTPEKRNYANNAILRFFCYIGKCLPVVREGSPSRTKVLMNKIHHLLKRGQSLMMFPEGKRSHNGLVDTENFAYGVGKIIQDLRRDGLSPKVLCFYLRGQRQRVKSNMPKRGDRFYVDVELVEPRSAFSGLRAARDMATQVIQRLAGMESAYFVR